MQVLKLEKKNLNEFLNKLRVSYELIAPIKKDIVRFENVENANDIYLEKNSYFPVKEYFFKKEETLFRFDGKKFVMPKPEKHSRVFFGLRKCDLNGIMHQDNVFMQQVHDPYYIAAREHSFLIGYHCNEAPSPYCFCGSLELKDYFDLMFYDRNEHFLVEIGSDKGLFLSNKYREFFLPSSHMISHEEKIIKNADRLENPDISQFYDNPGWKKGVDICLSCAACTALCPTCYCFEVHDEISTKDNKKSERKRGWSSCQVQEFTRVAGDHIFREDREQRFKHRIFHQLEYFKQKNGINLCVGCGRCIEVCPTRIDFVQIINDMSKDAKNKTA